MWTRVQSSCEKSIINALPKVVGFLRVLRFSPAWKVDRVAQAVVLTLRFWRSQMNKN